MTLPAEAFLLGISSGPACLASCGPVLLPALAAERGSARRTGLVLAEFLAGRLAGYLAFAVLAWAVGLSLAAAPSTRVWVFGFANLGLAVLLGVYAFSLPKAPSAPCGGLCGRYRGVAPAAIGLVAGFNLCPPFLAAGVRAVEGSTLPGALLFFLLFFVGTSLWFVPSLSVGLLRRFEPVAVVARFVLFLLAAYYGYLAVVVLGRAWIHA